MTSESTDGKQRGFDHPFLQACGMFMGEMMCMVAFFLVRWNRKRKQVWCALVSLERSIPKEKNNSLLIFSLKEQMKKTHSLADVTSTPSCSCRPPCAT